MARIRGVASESATSALVERGLIEEAGRSPFGAVLYRTTPLFLKLFGLRSSRSCPSSSSGTRAPRTRPRCATASCAPATSARAPCRQQPAERRPVDGFQRAAGGVDRVGRIDHLGRL